METQPDISTYSYKCDNMFMLPMNGGSGGLSSEFDFFCLLSLMLELHLNAILKAKKILRLLSASTNISKKFHKLPQVGNVM